MRIMVIDVNRTSSLFFLFVSKGQNTKVNTKEIDYKAVATKSYIIGPSWNDMIIKT